MNRNGGHAADLQKQQKSISCVLCSTACAAAACAARSACPGPSLAGQRLARLGAHGRPRRRRRLLPGLPRRQVARRQLAEHGVSKGVGDALRGGARQAGPSGSACLSEAGERMWRRQGMQCWQAARTGRVQTLSAQFSQQGGSQSRRRTCPPPPPRTGWRAGCSLGLSCGGTAAWPPPRCPRHRACSPPPACCC